MIPALSSLTATLFSISSRRIRSGFPGRRGRSRDAPTRPSSPINPIIYAEVSIRFASIEDLEEALAPHLFERHPLPWEAAFLAGKCFLKYRRRGGGKGSPLPDFYIGAHAAVAGTQLLTRDASRYRAYFPELRLIAP